MKRKVFALAAVLGAVPGSAVQGQAPSTNKTDIVLELVQTLQLQQSQLIDNQVKIDTKIADLAETMRLGRIESARAGGKHIPPSKKN